MRSLFPLVVTKITRRVNTLEITVSFGRNEDNKAREYANLAESSGYQPQQKLKVEPMTLKALYRERVEKDLDLPSEHFNLFKGNKTKITRSK